MRGNTYVLFCMGVLQQAETAVLCSDTNERHPGCLRRACTGRLIVLRGRFVTLVRQHTGEPYRTISNLWDRVMVGVSKRTK